MYTVVFHKAGDVNAEVARVEHFATFIEAGFYVYEHGAAYYAQGAEATIVSDPQEDKEEDK